MKCEGEGIRGYQTSGIEVLFVGQCCRDIAHHPLISFTYPNPKSPSKTLNRPYHPHSFIRNFLINKHPTAPFAQQQLSSLHYTHTHTQTQPRHTQPTPIQIPSTSKRKSHDNPPPHAHPNPLHNRMALPQPPSRPRDVQHGGLG